MQIKGKTAIVTGGASGLGEAVVRRFAADGANVAIFDLSEENGNRIADELGGHAAYYTVNVASEESVKAAIDRVMEKFGRIDVLVNVAGIGKPKKILGKDGIIPMEDFTRIIDVNLIGSVITLRLAAEQMAKNEPNEDGERGVIINTSSIASYHGQPGQAAYSASKGGINSMSLPIAREMARSGIRISAIAPGLFLTPLYKTPGLVEALSKDLVFPKRFGKPSEFADLAACIVGNPMINGDTIRLDGAVRF